MGEISGSHARDKRETKEQTTQKNCKLPPSVSELVDEASSRSVACEPRSSHQYYYNYYSKTQHNYYYYYLELERQKSFTLMLIDLSRRVIVLIPQSRFNTHHHHHHNKTNDYQLNGQLLLKREKQTNK